MVENIVTHFLQKNNVENVTDGCVKTQAQITLDLYGLHIICTLIYKFTLAACWDFQAGNICRLFYGTFFFVQIISCLLCKIHENDFLNAKNVP